MQFGMSQNLYYFVPRSEGPERRAFVAQSFVGLFCFASAGVVALVACRDLLAKQFGNPDLAALAVPCALVMLTMVVTTPLEVHLTAQGKVRSAAVAIFLSEGLRIALSVVPLWLGLGLAGLLWANVVHGLLRVAACAWLMMAEGGPAFSWPLFREQLRYSLPFGAAICLLVPQQTFHQWAVGARVTPSEFAVYMVGCFQVPIINLLYSPISDVLQVRLAAPGGRGNARVLFHEANLRLAAVFFPLCAGLCAAGSLFVPALFTHRYDQSVPIFRLALLTIPFAALPLDGTLRALGETRYIAKNSACKLALVIPAVLGGLQLWGMAGAIIGHAAVEAVMRTAMLVRVRRDLGCSLLELLPWRHLGRLAGAALIACAPVLAIDRLPAAPARPFLWLLIAGAAYGIVYAAALALGPGQGSPALRLKRALLGNAEAPALKRAA
jgi:O-antigen/teichoic acid export membrane protein